MSKTDRIDQTRRLIARRLRDRYPHRPDWILLSRFDVDRGITDAGGITRASATAIGILEPGARWELPGGWRSALDGMYVPPDAYSAYVAGRDVISKKTSRRRKRGARGDRKRRTPAFSVTRHGSTCTALSGDGSGCSCGIG